MIIAYIGPRMTCGDTLNKWIRWCIDNIYMILIVVGCCCGILSFFVNWETVIEATTTGLDFAFGKPHEYWMFYIGSQVYIPLIIFVCSIISGVTLIYNTYHEEKMHRVMIFVTICGLAMTVAMIYWSVASFDFEDEIIYFADYVGNGTILAWTASIWIMIGGWLYIASEVTHNGDGQ